MFEAIPSLPADFEKFKRRKKCPVPLLEERNGKASFLSISSKIVPAGCSNLAQKCGVI